MQAMSLKISHSDKFKEALFPLRESTHNKNL
jgi:hypothetical protein